MGAHTAQPVGIAGIALGDVGLVSLQIQVEETGVCKEVPCHVFVSEKPIWQGELGNCTHHCMYPCQWLLYYCSNWSPSLVVCLHLASTTVQYNHNQTVPYYIHLVTKDQWELPLDQHLLHHLVYQGPRWRSFLTVTCNTLVNDTEGCDLTGLNTISMDHSKPKH